MLHPSLLTGLASTSESANIPCSYTRLIGRELDLQARDLPKLCLLYTSPSPRD